MREKVPLRVKGLVTKVSIRVEVWLCEVEVGYASGEGEEGMVKDGGGGIRGEVDREEGEVEPGEEEGSSILAEGALVRLGIANRGLLCKSAQ